MGNISGRWPSRIFIAHAGVLVLLACVGCVAPSSIRCDDGTICPSGTVCSMMTAPDVCVTPAQVRACASLADGAACDTGWCDHGVCVPIACGNHRVDLDEACDDGNQTSGDKCSGDCKSKETCGNGILDALTTEQCDDGNFSDHDGCSSTCKVEQPTWTQLAINKLDIDYGAAVAFDTARGQTILFGGVRADNSCSATTWLWNGRGWSIATSSSSGPTARTSAAMAYDSHRRRVVLFGGMDCGGGAVLGDTWEWDGAAWSHIPIPTVSPDARTGAMMAYDAKRERVVLFGGSGPDMGSTTVAFHGDTWEWDGTTWSKILDAAAVPSARNFGAMAYDSARGRIVMFGGVQGGSQLALPNVYEYDGTAWTEHVTSIVARSGSAMAWDAARQQVVMFGGNTGSGATDEMWAWTGQSWTALAVNPAIRPGPRGGHVMASDPINKTLVVASGDSTPTTWVWSQGAWTDATPTLPQPPMQSVAAFDAPRGRAVMFDSAGSTWESDGLGWTSSASAPTPARTIPAMAYDAAEKRTVLFGGYVSGGGGSGDTWLWDGTTWTHATPATSPSARVTAMAYDGARRQVVLFGGTPDPSPNSGSPIVVNDTWLWNGTTWTQASPAHHPTARYGHVTAYDPVRRQILLFGGEIPGNPNTFVTDTWVWDGTDWKQVSSTYHPDFDEGNVLVWNANRQRLEMFGSTSDIWEWDGAQWTLLTTGSSPPPRSQQSIFPAADGSGVILFGGVGPTRCCPLSPGPVFDDTWRLRWEGPDPGETCVGDVDLDGDGLIGCADQDCWYACTPDCPPGTTCDPTDPTCGDGACDAALESCRICSQDCGACAATCGDAICDPAETPAACPGDCH